MSLKIRTGDANFGPCIQFYLSIILNFILPFIKKPRRVVEGSWTPSNRFRLPPSIKKNSISKGIYTPLNQKFLLVGFTIKYFKNIKIYITRTSG